MSVGGLMLAVVFGCSLFKPRAKHPGWNLQEACRYLDDVDVKLGWKPDESCRGGGFVRSEDGLLHQEKRPGNLGSAIYQVLGKANKAEEIEFSITSSPDVNNSNHRVFLDYSQKLFKKVFNKEMPDQMRNDIVKLGKLEDDISGQGSVNKPLSILLITLKSQLLGVILTRWR